MLKIIEKIIKTDINELPLIIRNSIYIIIFSIFAGFIINIFNPGGFTLVSRAMENQKQIVLISSEEAKIKLDSGSALFIDSRQDNEYDLFHIPDSINIPATPASIRLKKIRENFDLISGPIELVIYCEGLSCGSSQILSEKLIEMGYSKHIYLIEKGIPEWEEKGYPVQETNHAENESAE